MRMRTEPVLCCLAVLLPAVLAGGCAGGEWRIRPPETFQNDVAEQRRQRRQTVEQSIDRNRTEARLREAENKMLLGDARGAEQDLRAILETEPEHGEARDLLDGLEQALSVRDGWVTAEHGPADRPAATRSVSIGGAERDLETAAGALRAGESQRAAKLLLDWLAAPHRTEADALRAAALALQFNESATAARLAEVGLQRFPGSAGLYRALGTAEYRQGDYAGAQSSFQQALALDNAHPLSYFLLGLALRKQGDPEAAERHLRRAAALDPRYAR